MPIKLNTAAYAKLLKGPRKRKPRKARQKATTALNGQRLFDECCDAHDLPRPAHEYPWNLFELNPVLHSRTGKPYAWRFDHAWVPEFVALEVEGGAWTHGRHQRGKGFLDDMKKYNEAALSGWIVVRCVPDDIQSGAAFALVKRALEARK